MQLGSINCLIYAISLLLTSISGPSAVFFNDDAALPLPLSALSPHVLQASSASFKSKPPPPKKKSPPPRRKSPPPKKSPLPLKKPPPPLRKPPPPLKKPPPPIKRPPPPLKKPPPPPRSSPPPPTPPPPFVLSPPPPSTPPPPTDCPFTPEGSGPSGLPTCVLGYAAAAGVTGGLAGNCPKVAEPPHADLDPRFYTVTSNVDKRFLAEFGTLRWATSNCDSGGVYITFASSMTINLVTDLYLGSNLTLDARGLDVKILGKSVKILNERNVIIINIEFGQIAESEDTDALPIRSSSGVWIDHCRVTNAIRGTADVVYGSTDVTISNTFIQNGNLTQLLGADDADRYDQNMRVTLFRNWYHSSGQRQPTCRWGKCHVANCLYTDWGFYTIGARAYANVRSERNVFIPGSRKEVTPYFNGALATPGFDFTSTIRSYGDFLFNGTVFSPYPGTYPPFNPPYRLPLTPADLTLADFVRSNAGPLFPS